MAKNSAVNLVVSAGPAISVPSVVGQQLTPATQLISDAGLNYTVKYVTSTKPIGTVLAQFPSPKREGQVHDEGALDGVGHPDVGLGAERARADRGHGRLHAPGRRPQRRHPDERLLGSVRQRGRVGPDPRTERDGAAQHAVNLVISNCVSVPGVVGQSVGSAESAIGAAGLVANTTTDTHRARRSDRRAGR